MYIFLKDIPFSEDFDEMVVPFKFSELAEMYNIVKNNRIYFQKDKDEVLEKIEKLLKIQQDAYLKHEKEF